MNDLIIELVRKIEMGEKFMGNEKELAFMDVEENDKYIMALEEQIEETEGIIYNVYYTLEEMDYDEDVCKEVDEKLFSELGKIKKVYHG